MATIHNLGFPRIGINREMKKAVEAYWRGNSSQEQLHSTGHALRARHWKLQVEAGLDLIPVGDFSWYDHVLDTSVLLGCVSPRFGDIRGEVDLDTYFRMARGRAPTGDDTTACEMTKWFDTNYHYMVPEFHQGQQFHVASSKLFDEVKEAREQGYQIKPVILGPLSFLWLGKVKGQSFDKLELLGDLLPVYKTIFDRLKSLGVEWVQIDEPILVLDLPEDWRNAYRSTYQRLQVDGLKQLVATYFGSLNDNTELACSLPVDGLHIDAVRGSEQVDTVIDSLPKDKILSLGVINGRNIWRTDIDQALGVLQNAASKLGERLWIGPSCSLLHTPVDLAGETKLDSEIKSWLAFAIQKLDEISILKRALVDGSDAVKKQLTAARQAVEARRTSERIHKPTVQKRLASVDDAMVRRTHDFAIRAKAQRARLDLPLYPTTTIGSFPQTDEIRNTRRDYKQDEITSAEYEKQIRQHIEHAVRKQEACGLDVLVHGEAERNDMVEYFGEQLGGFAVTQNGWVQSYGSRCVKPPIIYGDVYRDVPMTVDWTAYAQSLTQAPMKGMLTGPMTILQWSFARDDQPRSQTCDQIALALRDEVKDLEEAGIGIIQIDEPAFREGLPLRRQDWPEYLQQATRSFRLAASIAQDQTQIHTHMCYSEFNDIIHAIADLDADVITIETSRSDIELLDAFVDFEYPNEIGPGVYDIHSPNVPAVDQIVALIEKASERIPAARLWVNPDCGLKTRNWPEVDASIRNLVRAAEVLRENAQPRRAAS